MIREIVVISGKGGTGKTSLAASFACLGDDLVLCDADVDAANMHLLLRPDVGKTSDFTGGSIAKIDAQRCTECGTCRELCKFDAISEDFIVDELACEGCGVCVDLCPEKAIDFPVQVCGQWFVSETRVGPMVHARLGAGAENSGKLVSLVRQEARKIAENSDRNLLLTDGPPGIGCPVIAAIGGASVVVIVVEPTLSGMHDMQRVADLAAHFKVQGLLCINKYDLNEEMSRKVEAFAGSRNIQMVGRIPFDPVFTKAMLLGKSVFEEAPQSEAAKAISGAWQNILSSSAMNSLGLRDLSATIR